MNYLNQKDHIEIEYSIEPKIDGISASLTYRKEILLLVYPEEMAKRERILQKT